MEVAVPGDPSTGETGAPSAPVDSAPADSARADSDPPTSGESAPPVDSQPPAHDTAPDPDTLPDAPPDDGSTFFLTDVVQEIAFEVGDASMQALRAAPRDYATATFLHGGEALEVSIRVKGNTQFRAIDDKPSLVIDFNRVVAGQTHHGMASVYLHNMTYDPSMMHEHLAYWFLRDLGVPAARTTYARVTFNGQDYGLYVFVEKQNRVYKERYWADTSGSLFEVGSFNHGCDLNDVVGPVACDCFEVDDVGSEEDPAADLDRLCRVASASGDGWYEGLRAVVDVDVFLQAMAGEMVTSHYDNYGWNGNNWRIYHEPTEDLWYWTPWSTDLAYGWYPWSGQPHCGEYGQHLAEYDTGYLMNRCWRDAACRADLEAAVAVAADRFEALDAPAEIDRVLALIVDHVRADTRRWYDDVWFDREVQCNRDWAAARPAAVRAEL